MNAMGAIRRGGSGPSGLGPTEAPEIAPEIVVLSNPEGREASAIQGVASELATHHLHDGHRGLALCAVSRGVGLSFVTSNLAVALAQREVSVLLVDANLQHPGLGRLFRLPGPVPGLADLLRDPELALGQVVSADVLPGLSILYAGLDPSAGHQELLGSDALQSRLESAMRNYDFVLVDTSAANLSADARRVASVVGYAVVVVRKDETFVEDVATLLRELTHDGVSVVGTVLNAA